MKKTEHDTHQQDTLIEGEHDGIREYDNDLPRWWLYLFYLTIVFACGYTLSVHLLFPDDGTGYKQEIAALDKLKGAAGAEEAPAPGEADLLKLTSEPAIQERGRLVFASRCAACHGAAGEGMIGPNLTDDYWLHGGKLSDIHKVIQDGVLDKGMLAWKGLISKDELISTVVHVWNLHGSAPANPKAPQGEIFNR